MTVRQTFPLPWITESGLSRCLCTDFFVRLIWPTAACNFFLYFVALVSTLPSFSVGFCDFRLRKEDDPSHRRDSSLTWIFCATLTCSRLIELNWQNLSLTKTSTRNQRDWRAKRTNRNRSATVDQLFQRIHRRTRRKSNGKNFLFSEDKFLGTRIAFDLFYLLDHLLDR